MYNEDESAIIALDSIIGLEYKHKRAILKVVKNPRDLLNFDAFVFDKVAEIIERAKANTVRMAFTKQYFSDVMKELDEKHIRAITYLSSDYPKLLKEVAAPPLVLYVKGNVSLLSSICFGIVGSRKTLPYALKFAENMAQSLTDSGVTIVTGSAVGGDRAAILGALKSGRIISVLAHGHDMIYPESNRELIEKVEKCGLVVSEYPPKAPARAWSFPVRNRIIAGLSRGVLIISGEKTSGARHTANYALEANRDVFALPYSIGIASGELCNDLIKNGAYLCDSQNDILDDLGIKKDEEKPQILLEPQEELVYVAIKDGADNVNSLIAATKLKIFEIAPIISSLELKGFVVRLAGNKFKAIK